MPGSRTPDRWTLGSDFSIELLVADADSEASQMVHEYAVLLTETRHVAAGVQARITTPGAQIPLWWAAHRSTQLPLVESPWVEDILEALLGRAAIEAEISGLPGELSEVARDAAKAIAADPSSGWLLARILVGARETPRLTDAAIQRLRRLGSGEPPEVVADQNSPTKPISGSSDAPVRL
jgi:hypothetical protein